MDALKNFAGALLFASAISAQAFVISDLHEYNAALINGQTAGVNFNLTAHGYNHHTDSITGLKLTFNFREIVETEEDMENWEDMSNWEFIIFYSWIFDGRSIYADVDTGPIEFSASRTKTYACQYYDYLDGDATCLQNLDLYGEMSSWFVAYTDNLWLGEVRLDAEIVRAVPEPAPVLLFGLGLLGVAARKKFR
jgi:hypothetical protein